MKIPRDHSPWSVIYLVLVALLLSAGTGCQVNYLLKSAISQADLLMRRVPLEETLNDPTLSAEYKHKLRLAIEARTFAERELGLRATLNYTSYVQLDRPYVTYVVHAAPRTELKQHLWSYPLVGALPYRGYFDPDDAREEAEDLKREGLDTYVRGVSAYSTLGWFRDPILSSMLLYKDHDLVNTIIHETVHATLYISSEADFNERLATYIGNLGTEMFYRKREGPDSPTVALIRKENEDDKNFSEFISEELKRLSEWYDEREGKDIPEEERQARLRIIRERFIKELRPKLGGGSYRGFDKGDLNNARLLSYRLYFEDLSDFETMFNKLGRDFKAFLNFCKSLEDQDQPSVHLAEKIKQN